jgi:2,3-bisphosphoglycerate-dependent phosphoglycerate mutase
MLFLIRHAHSLYDPSGPVIPDEKRELSAAGHAAAQRVADILEPRGISLIVSSPYVRAVQTVQPLADRLGVRIERDDHLRERRLGAGHVDDFRRVVEQSWVDFDLVRPGGESNRDAQTRISVAIRRLADAAAGRNAAIASHGQVLALFLRTMNGEVGFRFWEAMSMPDVYAVEASPAQAWSYLRVWQEGG